MRQEQGQQVKSVGIWIRVSTEDQARGESPEHHEKRARAYAEARGWEVAEVYHLEGVSGKAVMAHAEAKRMLADVRKGVITGLVFSKLARLARNTRELLDFADIFRDAGADLISLQEAIDTSSPAGRLFFTMIAAMATWEREEIASRVQASVPIRAQLGKPIGGAAPFGYRWVNKKLEPDPAEAPVRALLYELFATHGRKKTVARILNERGYRTRNGSPFSDTTVSRLIEDPTAKGLHRANYTTTNDRTKNWSKKPESEWVHTPVEAIVSEELWERCNAIVQGSRERHRPPARKTRHLFAGFAYCACGGKMYVWSNSPKYVCVDCRTKIPVGDLEAVYRNELQSFLISPEEIRAHAEAASQAIQDKERLIESGEAELKRLAEDEAELFKLYYAKALSVEDFGRSHRPLSERRKQLENELPHLQAERDLLRIELLNRDETLVEARDLASRWDALPFDERRQIVETITERITVGTEEITISLLNHPFEERAGLATRACRCGHGGLGKGHCGKAPRCQRDYQNRVSGPLMDRIDLQIEVPPVTAADLSLPPPVEGTAEAAARVIGARAVQEARGHLNARLEGEALNAAAGLDPSARNLLSRAAEAGHLTARGWTRSLRLARTIADLDGADAVRRVHVAEALIYRRTGVGAEAAA